MNSLNQQVRVSTEIADILDNSTLTFAEKVGVLEVLKASLVSVAIGLTNESQ